MERYKRGDFFSYEFVGQNSWNGFEHNCLFTNLGDGKFVDVGRPTGSDSLRDSRGVAVADFDGDGRLDLMMNSNNDRPTLYMNRLARAGNWLALELQGRTSNRDAVGAKVGVRIAQKTMTRQVEAGSGYASQSSFVLHFGLGRAESLEALEITWPSGLVERLDRAQLEGLGVNRRLRVQERRGNETTSKRSREKQMPTVGM